MTVPSYQFLGFALLVALLVGVTRLEGPRKLVILTANIAFLASFWASPVSYIPFALFVLYGFGLVLAMQARLLSRLWVAVTTIIILFCWIKRYTFIPEAILINAPYLTVGLSYIFFRMLSLVINVGQGVLMERIRLVDYLNYTLNFTSLTAGPIQTYEDYQSSRVQGSVLNYGRAAERIIEGLFKVLIMSELLNTLLRSVIASLPEHAGAWAGAYHGALLIAVYPLYLYFNFSGYTDFVLGCALLMGIRLPENFDQPFTSKNFIEFWSRWHISLSSWLKTYVYNPLLSAMFRRIESPAIEPFLAVFAFFATFFLVGAWHGQNSEFLFFGVMQGGGVAVNKLYQILVARALGRNGYKALAAHRLYAAFSRGLTFTWFGFSLLWFWSNWTQMGMFVNQIGITAILGGVAMVVLVSTFVLQVGFSSGELLARLQYRGMAVQKSRYVRIVLCTTAVVTLVFSSVILNASTPDIVYKTF